MKIPIHAAVVRAEEAPRQGARARLREAAEAFESILIQQMFRRMREAQLRQGFFGEATGASTYEAMFDEGLARSVAAGSPLGIADLLERQWVERGRSHAEALRALRAAEQARADPTDPARVPQDPGVLADEVGEGASTWTPGPQEEDHENR